MPSPFFVSDLVVAVLIVALVTVLIVNRWRRLPMIPISLVLILAALAVLFGGDRLPYPLKLPINRFYISHHNATFDSYRKFWDERRSPVENYLGNSFCFDDFSGKKMFYDKERDYYAVMDGVLFTPLSVTKTFHANLTWADAELFIGGELVKAFKGTSESFDYTFSPGLHHIRIRINNVSGTPMRAFVSMSEQQPILEDDEIAQTLAPLIDETSNLYYTFGVKQKELRLATSDTPTVVFLRSASSVPTDWNVSNCAAAGLKAIVYNGVGNSINTDTDGILILRAAELPEVAKLPSLAECHDAAPVGLLCSNGPEKLNRLHAKIKQLTGRRLSGFTPGSTAQSVALPEIVLNDAKYADLATTEAQIAAAKVATQKRHQDPYYDKKSEDSLAWKRALKVSEEQIPLNQFRAFYLSLQQPEQIVHSEIVSRVAIKYSDKRKFHGLEPDNFAALWIGDFEFCQETKQELHLAFSWAKVKLVIDGQSVFDGDSNDTIPYTFSKGVHRIEIEYCNNYGQVDFVFEMLPQAVDVGEHLQALLTDDTKVYLFGTYGIDRSDHTLDLRLEDSDQSVVLFVTSYEPIHWHVTNSAKLKAVVFSSYAPGSSVTTDGLAPPVFRDRKLHYAGRLIPYCYDGPTVHCENTQAFHNAVDRIMALTGKRPDGFSSTFEPSFSSKRLKHLDEQQALPVPQMVLDDAVYDRVEREMEALLH